MWMARSGARSQSRQEMLGVDGVPFRVGVGGGEEAAEVGDLRGVVVEGGEEDEGEDEGEESRLVGGARAFWRRKKQ